jgi:hypothetical protein
METQPLTSALDGPECRHLDQVAALGSSMPCQGLPLRKGKLSRLLRNTAASGMSFCSDT